jgi:hypothetical protein
VARRRKSVHSLSVRDSRSFGVDILTDCEIFILHLLAIFAAVEPEGEAMLVGPDPVLKGCYSSRMPAEVATYRNFYCQSP